MYGLVDHESARLTEALAAHGALERLLLGVHVAVVAQMVLAPKGLAAYVARIGPLVGVRALVDEQVVGLGEVARAEAAYVLLALAFANVCACGCRGRWRGRGRRGGQRRFVWFALGCCSSCWHALDDGGDGRLRMMMMVMVVVVARADKCWR